MAQTSEKRLSGRDKLVILAVVAGLVTWGGVSSAQSQAKRDNQQRCEMAAVLNGGTPGQALRECY